MKPVSPCLDPEVGQGSDYDFLKLTDIAVKISSPVPQVNHRIADQLTGPVIGNITSPIDKQHRNVFIRQLRAGSEDVFYITGLTDRESRGMLQKQQNIGNLVRQPPAK